MPDETLETTIAELKKRVRLTDKEIVAAKRPIFEAFCKEEGLTHCPDIPAFDFDRIVAIAASEKAIRETLRWAADRLREHVRTASYEGTRWILVHWFEILVKTLLEAEGLAPPEETRP